MIMKPLEEIYPNWGDESENTDPELHNLIVDIIEDKFVKGYWDVKVKKVESLPQKGKNVKHKRKKNVEEELSQHSKKNSRKNVEVSEPPNKKEKRDDDCGIITRESDQDCDRNLHVSDLVKLVEKLYTRFDDMERNISGIVGGIESNLEAKLDEKYGHRITLVEDKVTLVEDKVGLLENEINRLKELLETGVMENSIVKDGNSKVEDQEFCSPMIRHKKDKSPEKGYIEHLKEVKEDKKENKDYKKENLKPKDKSPEKGYFEHLKEVKEEKNENKDYKKENLKPKDGLKLDCDVVDITEKYREEENKLLAESEENEEEKLRQTKINDALDLLHKSLISFDGAGIAKKRKFSPPPPYPYIGETGLTYMRKGVVPSVAIYDPLKPVDEAKLAKVYELLAQYNHIPLSEKKVDEDILFYRILITPRKDWPDSKYGWLYDYHMAAFFRLLRKRSMEVPTPFHTDRIDFLDQWFVSMWFREYSQFAMNPKNWKFDQKYIDLANGLSPIDMPTKKKWVYDVDNLFVVHQISGCHWITLDIDLVNEKIDCYDSIMGEGTVEQDKAVHEQCRVFTRMIPALLNQVIAPADRKPSRRQFAWRRRKGIPQNDNPGDCGVYSAKYAECLALGVVFEGLSDRNIQALRLKMAAEIYDEVPEMYAQFT